MRVINRYFIALTTIVILTGNSSIASGLCKYKNVNKFTNLPNVTFSKVLDGRSERSGETTNRLYVVFKNEDLLIAEQKYCDMYNFEINFFSKQRKTDVNINKAIEIITKIFTKYAYIQGKFKKSLNDTILSEFTKHGFQKNKNFERGLPNTEVELNSSVEYSITYIPYRQIGNLYNFAIGLYWGVGGE